MVILAKYGPALGLSRSDRSWFEASFLASAANLVSDRSMALEVGQVLDRNAEGDRPQTQS